MEVLSIHSKVQPPAGPWQDIVDLTDSPTTSPIAHSKQPYSPDNPVKNGPTASASQRLHDHHPLPSSSLMLRSNGSTVTHPLTSSGAQNRPNGLAQATSPSDDVFGSSIKAGYHSTPSRHRPITTTYSSYIKTATPGAFKPNNGKSSNAFDKPAQPSTSRLAPNGYDSGWPSWLTQGQPNLGVKPVSVPSRAPSRSTDEENPSEKFDLDTAPITAEDYVRHQGDADDHMRELLSGAIGDAEGEMGDEAVKEGEDIIEGFAKGVRLMPHQVRGVRWMRGRESGRKYGGILADVSGFSSAESRIEVHL